MTPIEALQADLLTVKSNLAIAFVMEHYGFSPEMQDPDGRLHYINPFRNDTHPSFDVFSMTIKGRVEPEERWGDYAEGTNKDVIDLIERFDSCSRTVALSKARDLLAEQIESDWNGPTVELSNNDGLNVNDVEALVDLRRPLAASETWHGLTRSHPGLSDVLLPRDRVFLHPQHDTLVFMLYDEDGDLHGVRFRGFDDSKYGLAGGRNILMRLDEPKKDRPVFLCEGETDTWAAWGVLGDEYEVLGVPGMGNHPEKTSGKYLANRIVYLAFDPDTAGDLGRQSWTDYLVSIGCDIRTVILPAGKDIALLHPEVIELLPGRARVLPTAPERFIQIGDRYMWVVNKNGDVEERSNWSFEPDSVLVGEGGERAYKGVLLPHGRTVTLPDSALSSSSQIKAWGRPYQARWYGTDAQVQHLAALVDHQAAYLPEGRVHNQVGLYQGTFVWPGQSLGDIPVEYTPPVSDVGLGSDEIFLTEDMTVDAIAVFEALYRTQDPGVTTPMLAWLAAAPLRMRFHQFPILNISGASGSGKSELTDEFLRVFSSTHIAAVLTSTTPYAVSSFIDSSCGFPVWFDEYRPGARESAINQLDQLIRDTYTKQDSVKGGQDRSNLSALSMIRTAAPLIISGEDSFTETSHTDRMVLVRLREAEQGAFPVTVDSTGFGHTYLRHLTLQPLDPSDPEPPVFTDPVLLPTGLEGSIRPRQDRNVQVLQYGWRVLREFLQRFDPQYSMPELDLSRVVAAGVDAGQSNPVMDLIKVCMENDTNDPVAWIWEDYLCVSPDNLIKESRHYPSITLPVSVAKGLRDLLIEQHHAEAPTGATYVTTPQFAGRRIRALRIPVDTLDWLDTLTEPEISHDTNPSL